MGTHIQPGCLDCVARTVGLAVVSPCATSLWGWPGLPYSRVVSEWILLQPASWHSAIGQASHDTASDVKQHHFCVL